MVLSPGLHRIKPHSNQSITPVEPAPRQAASLEGQAELTAGLLRAARVQVQRTLLQELLESFPFSLNHNSLSCGIHEVCKHQLPQQGQLGSDLQARLSITGANEPLCCKNTKANMTVTPPCATPGLAIASSSSS